MVVSTPKPDKRSFYQSPSPEQSQSHPFLTMLETWDAAVNYLPSKDGKNMQPIVIAELLGWTQLRTRGRYR